MRNYLDKKQEILEQVVCNGCGSELQVENGILKEGCFEGRQKFGFFSSKDGQEHHFDLCEECYSKMIQEFELAIEVKDVIEFI
ncbi:MAG: hypothetical protein R3Y54_02710 [Eubacteriales bacterium]